MESGQVRSSQVWLNDMKLRMIEMYVSRFLYQTLLYTTCSAIQGDYIPWF